MKKLLGILVLGLLWCNVAHSSCKDDLLLSVTEQKGKHLGFFIYNFTNPTKNKIKIISYEFLSKKGETMIKRSGDFHVRVVFPFTRKSSGMIGRGGLMTELIGEWHYECKYIE